MVGLGRPSDVSHWISLLIYNKKLPYFRYHDEVNLNIWRKYDLKRSGNINWLRFIWSNHDYLSAPDWRCLEVDISVFTSCFHSLEVDISVFTSRFHSLEVDISVFTSCFYCLEVDIPVFTSCFFKSFLLFFLYYYLLADTAGWAWCVCALMVAHSSPRVNIQEFVYSTYNLHSLSQYCYCTFFSIMYKNEYLSISRLVKHNVFCIITV